MCSNKWMQKFVAGMMAATMMLSLGTVTAMAQSTDTNNNLAPTPIDPIVVNVDEEVLGAVRPVDVAGVDAISEGFDAVAATEGQNVAAANLASDMGENEVIATAVVTAAGATQDANGNFNYAVKVPGVKAGDEIFALVYADGEWVKVYPTVVGDGYLMFSTKVLGVMSIVRANGKQVASVGTAKASGSASVSSDGQVLGASRGADVAPIAAVDLGGQVLGAGRSPKTADNGNGLLIMMAVACFAVAGGIVYTGKKRA